MGHVIAGETSLEAILREVQEEIGLLPNKIDPCHIGRVVWEQYNHMIDIYSIQTDFEMKNLVMQQEEVIGLSKITKEKMASLVSKMDYRPSEYRSIVLEYLHRMNQKI